MEVALTVGVVAEMGKIKGNCRSAQPSRGCRWACRCRPRCKSRSHCRSMYIDATPPPTRKPVAASDHRRLRRVQPLQTSPCYRPHDSYRLASRHGLYAGTTGGSLRHYQQQKQHQHHDPHHQHADPSSFVGATITAGMLLKTTLGA